MADSIKTVAVLAGGLATRMRPITETLPKSLLDVAGEPFVAHQLRLLRREGMKRVVLCLGYLGDQVMDFVGDGSRFGLDVAYSFDGDTLVGTGGAIHKALPLLDDPFFVVYGDSYLDTNYAAVGQHFLRSGAAALMTVFRNEGKWDTSNVVFRDGELMVYSKRTRTPDMHFIDYGLGILTGRALEGRQPGVPFELAEVYEQLAAKKKLAGYEIASRFYEIGSREGLADLDFHLRRGRAATPMPNAPSH